MLKCEGLKQLNYINLEDSKSRWKKICYAKKLIRKKIQYNKALGFAADASYILKKSNPITENWSDWFNLRNEKFPNSSVVKKIRGKFTGCCDWN